MTAREHGDGGSTDREHLERSRRVWDRWSSRYGSSERDFAPMHDAAVDALGLAPGDSVLEIGCGPGTNVARLHERVGPSGHIVAVDLSSAMVDRARERARDQGFENVDVVRADASSVAFEPGQFDAALASLSLSVTPDPVAAAERVREALVPGARFVVFDLRTVPAGPLRAFNPLLSAFYRWFANWNADADVEAALSATFDDVVIEETYAAGTAYRAVAGHTLDDAGERTKATASEVVSKE